MPSLAFSFSPGVPESSDEGVTPSLILAWVKGDRPRVGRLLEPFLLRVPWSLPDGVEEGVVLPRRGRPVAEDRDGGRSSPSTGVVLRDGVREWESERVLRRVDS